jgi:hypothetical protein
MSYMSKNPLIWVYITVDRFISSRTHAYFLEFCRAHASGVRVTQWLTSSLWSGASVLRISFACSGIFTDKAEIMVEIKSEHVLAQQIGDCSVPLGHYHSSIVVKISKPAIQVSLLDRYHIWLSPVDNSHRFAVIARNYWEQIWFKTLLLKVKRILSSIKLRGYYMWY